MAQAVGFDVKDLIDDLQKHSDDLEDIMKEMVSAGADVTVNAVRNRTPGSKLPTKLKKGKPKVKAGGVVSCGFAFSGKDKTKVSKSFPDGTPYGAIAIFNEYGVPGHQPARPFLRTTISSCEGRVKSAMQDVYDKRVK